MTQFVALLRGINVGGNNIIRMADLRACFEGTGCLEVATYIASGNVVFSSRDKAAPLTSRIEEALSERFNYTARIVLLDYKQLEQVVRRAPAGFGKSPKDFRYDVIFLKPPLTETQALKSVSLKEGVDTAVKGKGVLYFSRLIAKAEQSHLTKLIALPLYKDTTVRNWNTTTKLLAMMSTTL